MSTRNRPEGRHEAGQDDSQRQGAQRANRKEAPRQAEPREAAMAVPIMVEHQDARPYALSNECGAAPCLPTNGHAGPEPTPNLDAANIRFVKPSRCS